MGRREIGWLLLLAVLVGCSSQRESWRERLHWPWIKRGDRPTPTLPPPPAHGEPGDPLLGPLEFPDTTGQRPLGAMAPTPAAGPETWGGVPATPTPAPVEQFASRDALSRPAGNPAIELVGGTRWDRTSDRRLSAFTTELRQIVAPAAPRRPYRFVILHPSGSEGGNLQLVDRFDREVLGRSSCGYHFVVGNGSRSGDGEIEVAPRWLEQRPGAHMPTGVPTEYDLDGIGVCLIGDPRAHDLTIGQQEATRRLLDHLQEVYGIANDQVFRCEELVARYDGR